MSLWKKLFGAKPDSKPQSPASSPTPAATDIKVYDEHGRELYISRDQWRTNILPGALADARTDPDKLYNTIVHALDDGFAADVLESAQHLRGIDPNPVRGACLLGIVYMTLNRLADAEAILRQCMAQHGENGVVMTNLAKVYASNGERATADATLWRALELDPNQDNGLAWYVAIEHERGGDAASDAAYQRVAAVPGSWRAQLWLARRALERDAITDALALYAESLSRMGAPHADALMQISGDLGKHGRLSELVDLIGPRFDPTLHGIAVGNNMLKAYIDLSMFGDARRVLADLFALHRPDYRETLGFWEKELDDRTRGFGPVHDTSKAVAGVLRLSGVVWAREKEGFAALLPTKDEAAPRIAVMAASCALANAGNVPLVQRTNVEGSFSRALSLALSEVVHLETTAHGETLIVLMEGESASSFVLSNAPWEDAQVIEMARRNDASISLAVNLHVDATQPRWCIVMTVLRVSDGGLLERIEVPVDLSAPDGALDALGHKLRRHALTLAGVRPQARPAWTLLPSGAKRASWMAGCEQALAIQCAAMEGQNRLELYAPRNIVDGLLSACLEAPTSIAWRMLALTSLNRLKRIEPSVVAEYRDRLASLQRKLPIDDVAGTALNELATAIMADG